MNALNSPIVLYLLLILAVSSTFSFQAVMAASAVDLSTTCKRCIKLWEKLEKVRKKKEAKNKKFNCMKVCERLQGKPKFSLSPVCDESCCESLCEEKYSGFDVCIEENYCLVSVEPSESPSELKSGSPSGIPSESPSESSETPSDTPSTSPSNFHSTSPTTKPSALPSESPSRKPSFEPSLSPSDNPSAFPSEFPSMGPSLSPSDTPSMIPSFSPSDGPSAIPSGLPSSSPSDVPSTFPSSIPSTMPSSTPSNSPSTFPSSKPSSTPSDVPSIIPSSIPSTMPSSTPSDSPSAFPSTEPSSTPSNVPSISPSGFPSMGPSSTPSGVPSVLPSVEPSSTPSDVPSASPSKLPSLEPSSTPSDVPSASPSRLPSLMPSSTPSDVPSTSPSGVPSVGPSSSPSDVPSASPSAEPSSSPSDAPSASPSELPSLEPSSSPSDAPSASPSELPSLEPSSSPSDAPSASPSELPSLEPSSSPSDAPSESPSELPSLEPSSTPSHMPSSIPSVYPSTTPSSSPSDEPSTSPSALPSMVPSTSPSDVPSASPSALPSVGPSSSPSDEPSTTPSGLPSMVPSASPSDVPSTSPSGLPSVGPSSSPSDEPSTTPSGLPSMVPSASPSAVPSTSPSGLPSGLPSLSPSDVPSASPSGSPSSGPSSIPSGLPSFSPSEAPSKSPSGSPSAGPSSIPSNLPSFSPSEAPSKSPSGSPSAGPSSIPSNLPSFSPSEVPSTTPSGLPSTGPSSIPSNLPSFSPSEVPSTIPSGSPSRNPSDIPSTTPSGSPSESPSETPLWTSLSRDLVEGSQLNGPHYGSRHGWAWPGVRNTGCARYKNLGVANTSAWPCYVKNQLYDRVLNFRSSYMNFKFEFDQGMKATVALADTATASGGGGAQSISFYPSGLSGNTACSAPSDAYDWKAYPIRLVRSGRYLHHWYATSLKCNGGSDDTRMELKVTPDCVELHTISNNGAASLKWLNSADNAALSSSTNGYSVISYCIQCDSEVSGSTADDLTGCEIVQAQVPTNCCPLSSATNKDTDLCGTGWSYSTCDSSSMITTALTDDVTLSTTPVCPIIGEGHAFEVRLPQPPQSHLVNPEVVVSINNNSDKWRKVKINFHMSAPWRITGIAGVLRDPTTKDPTGIHVQMSKNWHPYRSPRPIYDGKWWTGVAHIRVPPGETKLELVMAFQYYMGLHGVSHSQLSLIGWATNGLWEEVGLGSNGEAITYEPHGHHRRQMILDTRPWLVGQGDPSNTRWTENHGGGDFLNAVDKNGFYQYLVRDTSYHTMNGPRLTNATYSGVTQDQNIQVSRTVSTWTADDFVRHLHSFNYRFLTETVGDQYPRFALYTLGGDNYNYVHLPTFAYGMGAQNSFAASGSDPVVPVSEIIHQVLDNTYNTSYFQVDAPAGCGQGDNGSCWFAMLTDPSISHPHPGVTMDHQANRGIIIRNFHGRLNGEAWPPPGATNVSPFTFSLVRSRSVSANGSTVSIEIGLPKTFLTAVENNQAKFMEGDYLSGDIELLLPPRMKSDYMQSGKSERLRTWLTQAGVDSDFSQGWKIIANEASKGDDIVTTVSQGTLERLYHPRIQVDSSDEARFNIKIPSDMPGILPITIAGVESTRGFRTSLLERPDGKLWRYVGSSWTVFGTGGDYQLEKDVLDNSYTYVYSLQLEFDQVTNCEQFAFGATAPVDTNPPCTSG